MAYIGGIFFPNMGGGGGQYYFTSGFLEAPNRLSRGGVCPPPSFSTEHKTKQRPEDRSLKYYQYSTEGQKLVIVFVEFSVIFKGNDYQY